jgi:hypothetical protein
MNDTIPYQFFSKHYLIHVDDLGLKIKYLAFTEFI